MIQHFVGSFGDAPPARRRSRLRRCIAVLVALVALGACRDHDPLKPDMTSAPTPAGSVRSMQATGGTTVTGWVPMASAESGAWEIGGVADMSGDGKPDVVWQNRTTRQTGVWIMDRAALVRWVPTPGVESGDWEIGGVADMTGDGKADIVRHNRVTLSTGVWVMDGTSYLGWIPMVPFESGDWQIGGVGDLTGDGKADVVWQNRVTLQTGVWVMDGTTYVRWIPIAPTVSGGWEMGGVGDMTGDGKADVVWQNRVTRQTGVWVMDGPTLTGWIEMPKAETGDWQIGAVADITGDGSLDVVWQNRVTLQTGVWVMGDAIIPRVDVRIYAPRDEQLVSDTLITIPMAVLYSDYSIERVGATLEGQPLEVTFANGEYRARANLPRFARGRLAIRAFATDVNGNVGTDSAFFRFDRRPTLEVTAPEGVAFADPNLRVAATCRDDAPACESLAVYARVSGPELGQEIARGRDAIDQTVSLADYEGQTVTLTFVARDSAGSLTSRQWQVEVAVANASLRMVALVPGRVLDADAGRVLWMDSTSAGFVLRIRDRSTGTSTNIASDQYPVFGVLTPSGVIYQSGPSSSYSTGSSVYEYRAGTITRVGDKGLTVNGRYAAYREGSGLIRRDLVSGATVTVLDPVPSSTTLTIVGFGVGPNGDVVYTRQTEDRPYSTDRYLVELFRYRDGTASLVTSYRTGYGADGAPITDGLNVVYERLSPSGRAGSNMETYAVLASGEEVALSGLAPDAWNEVDGGYIAYTSPDAAGNLQVHVRTPVGESRRLTSFSPWSLTEALNARGDVVIHHTGGGNRYLAPGGNTPLRSLGKPVGRAIERNGTFYVLAGRVLYEVTP